LRAEVHDNASAAPRRTTLSARVYEELRLAIVEGRLTDRDRLVEENLAKSLGVIRTPVREAQLRLEMEGYLARDSAGRLFAQRITAKEVNDFFLVRELLDGYGARLAAERVSDDEIESLEGVLSADFQASERNQVNQMARLNEEFHRLIQVASRNRFVADPNFDLGSRIPGMRSFVVGTEAQNKAGVEEHAAILRDIRRGDGAGAERQMRQHLRTARNLMLTHLVSALPR
jgi:DNA-binding GntR family transcriptional regulator